MANSKNTEINRCRSVIAFQPVNIWKTTYDKIRKSIAFMILHDRKESIAEFVDKAVDERLKSLRLSETELN
jgi:hypothetical protein